MVLRHSVTRKSQLQAGVLAETFFFFLLKHLVLCFFKSYTELLKK